MNPLLKEIRHSPMLWLLVAVPVVFAAATLTPEAHTALFVLSVLAIVPLAGLLSHATDPSPPRRATPPAGCSMPRLEISDRTGHRADCLARRRVHVGEGINRGRDRHQHAVHAGRLVPARRTQIPLPGVQPSQRASSVGSAFPGHDRLADAFGGRRSGLDIGCGRYPNAQPWPGRSADRRVRTGAVVHAQNAP